MSVANVDAPQHPFTVHGYAVVRRLLSPTDAAAVRHALEHGERPDVAACERPNNVLLPLRWDHPAVLAVLGDGRRLARLAAASAACDLRWTSGYLSTKEPGSGALPWHQDWWCWDHAVTWRPQAAQVAVLCYLDDTAVESGALRVLPGSHRRSVDLHSRLPGDDTAAGTLAATHAAMVDDPGQVTFEAREGDAVVVDYRLLHGTHPNTAGGRRHCLVLNFTPGWRDLPDDIRGHLASGWGLPTADECLSARRLAHVLPSDDAARRDLPLSRRAPATFGTAG
ncbi:MAG TPA: phytanoyl-CoA dioxygenase family protein [Acidimicrobiales bacterium]|nr:phytanoyl-CoA dioxygenase family protein [Acidimicrobiales bacterium]